jgi:sugar (pentulose or hexulose) kinase
MEAMKQENMPSPPNPPHAGATAVLDIGKTNAKLTLIAADGATLATRRIASSIISSGASEGAYPHHDTERIWDWLLATLREFGQSAPITAIVPVTHGATAALVDDVGLVLPVLDYESALPQSLDSYGALRPRFAESFSPDLPAGLNLGRQLAWLAHTFPEQFGRARHILHYPQYWAWRLSGVAASEVTSLGCHTDLWQPLQGKYSSLVARMGWEPLFPAQRAAWEPLGPLLPALAGATGLPADCQVLCGIHDSNASLLRYLSSHAGGSTSARAVLSTGTWVIAAAFGKPLDGLQEQADMLANVNALGQPVACMRFMGGREFGAIAGPEPVPCSQADLERLIGQGSFALPCFSESGGPFFGRSGAVEGPAPATAAERYALATLYCVLMSDYCLTALDATGPVVVEGSYTENPHFAPLLAALRAPQTVALTDDASGTTCGGWLLHRWGSTAALHSVTAQPLQLPGWQAYRQRWLELLMQPAEAALTA